nr:probable receptor-like protein kinase At5g18500 [Ipomoea batatas]
MMNSSESVAANEGSKAGQAIGNSRVTISMHSFSEEPSSLNISLKEIYSATNNLSASHFIGQGIAGKVYKGVLSNGQHVAIKHIIKDGQMETFVREVTSLSHIRHPNLVALLGHYDGQNECFLIYELCHNGNLSEWLFDKNKVLSWTQRLEIAIDCARGLLYLHTFPEGCIVHRDIKPTNILISANFQGKLSDFGLSKVIDLGNSYASSEAKNLTKGKNIKEFADPKFGGEYPEGAFELVFKLALSCTGLKQQRPSMDKVVATLENALHFSTRDKSLDPYFLPL